MDFSVRFFQGSNALKFDPSSKKINYDSIVDRSHFKINSETVRLSSASAAGSFNPVYDKDLKKSPPSDIEVALRSGKLDKAEVSQLILSEQERIKEETSEIKKKNAQLKADKEIKARQEYLDKMTGFKGSDQNVTV